MACKVVGLCVASEIGWLSGILIMPVSEHWRPESELEYKSILLLLVPLILVTFSDYFLLYCHFFSVFFSRHKGNIIFCGRNLIADKKRMRVVHNFSHVSFGALCCLQCFCWMMGGAFDHRKYTPVIPSGYCLKWVKVEKWWWTSYPRFMWNMTIKTKTMVVDGV